MHRGMHSCRAWRDAPCITGCTPRCAVPRTVPRTVHHGCTAPRTAPRIMLPRMHADATMSRARCAVPHATPHGPQVLVNQPVTLALPGARAGDLVMIVRQTAQGGCVEAASGGGGVLVTDGELQMRLHDRNLFLHEA
eukprot:scaffold49310_cov42-Phaeocystis_antarctica.AAC.2